MKVIREYNQHRRDLIIDMKCESCGKEENHRYAYDDRNFWDNVVPNFKCPTCDKSSNDLNINHEKIETKYPEYLQI